MGDFIKNIKNGVLYDMLWEPLKKTTKSTILERTRIPKGSYICYVISDGGTVFDVFADKKLAVSNYKKDRKKYFGDKEDISLILTYVTPKGDWIEHMVIG